MNYQKLGMWIAPLTLVGASTTQVSTSGLVRVAPTSAQSAGDFKVDEWRAKLGSADLDQRERDFDALVERAKRDSSVRAEIDKWAREGDTELAWTARLLLRDVDRRGAIGPRALLGPGFPGGQFPGAGGADPWQQFFDGMDRDFPNFFFGDPQSGLSIVPPSGGSTQSHSSSQSFQMNSGPDGVTVTITEDENGEQKKHEYKAESIDKLLQEHPELRDKIGVQGFGGGLSLGTDPLRLRVFGGASDDPFDRQSSTPPRTDVLGVTVRTLPTSEAKQYGLETGTGLVVERVERGSIAAALGIQRGHVLVEMNGRKLAAAKDITDELCQRPKDGEIKVELIDRWGQHRTRTWQPDNSKPEDAGKPQAPPTELRKI